MVCPFLLKAVYSSIAAVCVVFFAEMRYRKHTLLDLNPMSISSQQASIMNSIIAVGSLVSQYLGSIHDAVATFERTNPTIVALNDQIRGFERAAVRSVSSQFDEIVFSPGADPRTNQWALMEPALPLLLAAGYLVGVGTSCFVSSKIGKAAKLNPKNFSVVYNIVMVALSLYMSVETVLAAREAFGWDKERDPRLEGLLTVQLPGAPGFSWLGNGMDGQGGDRSAWATPGGQRLANVLYIHYISKYVEFVDTFLMILRQSWSQISFLHVYHHASTALSWYLIMRYNPGGECYWVSAANSMVHVFMYSYYAFAAAGFSARKFGFMKACKPWITRTQMAQFVSFLVQSVFLAIGTKQPVILPRMPVALEFFQGAMFLTLFSMFYLEDRRKAMQASVEKKASAATAPLVVEDVPGASRPSRRVVEESESKEAEDDTSDSKASASGVRQRRSGRVAIAE